MGGVILVEILEVLVAILDIMVVILGVILVATQVTMEEALEVSSVLEVPTAGEPSVETPEVMEAVEDPPSHSVDFLEDHQVGQLVGLVEAVEAVGLTSQDKLDQAPTPEAIQRIVSNLEN